VIGSTSQRDACSRALDEWLGSLRIPPKTCGTAAGAPRDYQSTGYVTSATHPRGSAPHRAPVRQSGMPHEKRQAG
jgi:hypothetical protein